MPVNVFFLKKLRLDKAFGFSRFGKDNLCGKLKMPSILKRVLIKVLALLRGVIDLWTTLVFGFIYRNKDVQLPPIKDFELLESAHSLAAKIRTGKLKSEVLLNAFITRIKDVNPIINAVVDQRFEEALVEARAVDSLVRSGKKSENQLAEETPFLGVPFTTKDCFNVKGLRQTVGLVSRKNCVSNEDAPAIQLMKQAGAIIVGVTNVSELCMWFESHNRVYGRTNNAYKTSRIVGGSSGGEGAIISAAGSVIGVGSDVGGSIRMPSFFNGIFGHKPTKGMVPIDGQLPQAKGAVRNYLVVGPMCRYATDLLPMFKVLSQAHASELRLDEPVDVKKLKIYYMENDGGFPLISKVHPDLKASMRKVLVHFEKAYGIKAQKVHFKEMVHSVGIWASKMGEGNPVPFASLMSEGKAPIKPWLEFLKWCLFCSNHTLPAIMLAAYEGMSNRDPGFVQAMDTKCNSLRSKLEEMLADDGVFLYQSHPRPAPYHNQTVFQAMNFAYTGIFNMLGLPVTQCPLGLGSDGVPLGVQVVANKFNDHVTIAVAQELERAFGGWVSPSQLP